MHGGIGLDAFLNGQMVPHDRATVHVGDAGFTHAVGLFETMAAYHGRIFRIDEHVNRLATSAKELGLAREVDHDALVRAVQKTLEHNKLERARLRLTITPGALSLLSGVPDKLPEPTVVVTAAPPTEYDPAYFERGVTVMIAGPSANPFDPMAGHKTLNYWARLRTLRHAAGLGAAEAIWLNITNHLASGSVSNLFLVKDEGLLTPFARGEEVTEALAAPVLPGITRAAVIELAEQLKIPVQRRMLTVEDLLDAEEVFLTNSSWLVLPVSKVERKEISSGTPGPITTRLREALLDLIERETTG